jgi:hypothetical protein
MMELWFVCKVRQSLSLVVLQAMRRGAVDEDMIMETSV